MRESRRAVDTDALEWQQLSDVMQSKVLNGDPQSGPHTMLLRSAPREPGPDFAQYHPVNEEFYCLDGDFTFDGTTWFGPGSYAYYPAYFVHGSHVHVRGGYCLYLRVSGFSELFKVADPEGDAPYYVGEGRPEDHALQLPDASKLATIEQAAGGGRRQVRPLHVSATGQGSALVSAAVSAQGEAIEIETAGLLEVFALSGLFALEGGAGLQARSYHCEVSERPRLVVTCQQAGTLMVSHDGALSARVAPAK